ncbi:MAG: polysaccharide deacetylase family protein, partial [Deltaproteobacteria bacterium]|nr:polysaccharide deacetylase family protein [Deltaproteobacteria bacterium]
MISLTSLPVLMYHYVSRFTGPINVTPDHFEQHCRGMAEHGWRGIGLDEAEAYLRGETALPRKSVLITFDDGFLDNMVYAAPILEKYGHQGTVFAVTQRIEPAGAIRPTVADVWKGQIKAADLPPVDAPLARHPLGYDYRRDLFMNWAEARILEQRGVMRIAAHTARHLAVFAGPEFPARRTGADRSSFDQAAARFHIPGRRGNTFYQLEADVPWGLPRFAEQPAMAGRAFLPSAPLVRAIRELVPQDKASAHAFFRQTANVEALHDLVATYNREARGVMESEAEQRVRVRNELTQCRNTLENELGHPVRSLCWPWGRAAAIAREEARALGFSVFFETAPGANPSG